MPCLVRYARAEATGVRRTLLTYDEAITSRLLLLSHLARALLFGAAAGWVSDTISDLETGWLLYPSALALSAAGGWVLVRPMERNTALAALVLWTSAASVFYLLRPPAEFGLLGAAESFGAYVELAAVLVCFGVGALLGRALARP